MPGNEVVRQIGSAEKPVWSAAFFVEINRLL